MNYTKIYHDLV
jgi:hypothetical protein